MPKPPQFRRAGTAGCITAPNVPPIQENYVAKEWQKPHRANPTGSPQAYRPPGSLVVPGERPRVTGDYDAWTPGN